jgi:superfamily I DNA/RNA helicase
MTPWQQDGDEGEHLTRQLLGSLSPYGFHFLHDRKWPGSTNANIDHIGVGPSGVYVIDTKNWTGDIVLDDSGLWQGQEPRSDVLEALQQQADVARGLLADLGLPPVGIRPVLVLAGRNLPLTALDGVWVVGSKCLNASLLREGKHLTVRQVEDISRRLMVLFPPRQDPPIELLAEGGEQVPEGLVDALFTAEDLEQAALEAAMRAPLEDWMVFLHPRQADFARRKFNGPALLRGGAGTGKTVVALHRLAYLAERRASSLLFLSFVRTLPAVQRAAYERLSPRTADRVEFASLHGWALQLLAERGTRLQLRPAELEGAYRDAWNEAGRGSVLDRPDTYVYWSEEVKQVIRGRRISSEEAYQKLVRLGRGSRLGPVQRAAVWQLKEAYESTLEERGLLDWEDVLRLALRSLEQRPLEVPYDCIVVDEVQDLTQTGIELAAAAARSGTDNLLLVGDSHQAVFAGGVSPQDAGITVRGRSTVLTVNYRNPAEVLEFASPLVADEEDLLGDGEQGPAGYEVIRRGLRPIVATARTRRDAEAALVSRLRRNQEADLSSWGGMAVLCARKADVSRYRQVLVQDGIPVVDLEHWAGEPVDAVKVGTIKRAKGLEFLYVFVPEVNPAILPGGHVPQDEVGMERLVRARRELYVAATRARDSLWMSLLGARSAPQQTVLDVPAQRDEEPSFVAPEAPAPEESDDVYGIARRLFGPVTGGPARFGQDGWSSQGRLPVVCDVCRNPLYALRKPYEVKGREYRYWALLCAGCGTAREPAELPTDVQKVLRRLVRTEQGTTA